MAGLRGNSFVSSLLWLQGAYFLLTGVWPLVSISTFKQVTGEKYDNLPTRLDADHWLVMTVGVLVTAIGLSLLVAAWQRRAAPETAVVAIGAAAGLMAIDIIYVSRQTIAPIYLLDAAIEAVLILWWLAALVSQAVAGPSKAGASTP